MQAETSYPAIIGRIIEFKRKQQGLDQQALADQLDITQSAWSRIERGQSGVSMPQLVRISEILNTKPYKIIEEADHAADSLNAQGVKVHSNIITKSDQAIAFLGLAALGALVAAILMKK